MAGSVEAVLSVARVSLPCIIARVSWSKRSSLRSLKRVDTNRAQRFGHSKFTLKVDGRSIGTGSVLVLNDSN